MDLSALRDGEIKKLDAAITDWEQMVRKLEKLKKRAEDELDAKAKKASWSGLNATVTKEFVTKTAAEFGDAVSQATSVHNILKDARGEILGYQNDLLDALDRAKKKGIAVEDIGEGAFLVRPLTDKGEDPPTTAELEAVKTEVTGFLDKATTSDDDAAKALRKLADLSKTGFADAPVIKDRDHALSDLRRAAIRHRGIELEKQYKKDTRWPYEWDENGEHPNWGDSYFGKVGWAERDLMKDRPLDGTTYLQISAWATSEADEEKKRNPDIDKNAYRHAIWQARLTYQMGEDDAELWADAHEAYHPKSAHPDHMADLVNNVYGRELGRETLEKVPERPAGMGGPGSLPEAEERIKEAARRYAASDDAANENDFYGFGDEKKERGYDVSEDGRAEGSYGLS